MTRIKCNNNEYYHIYNRGVDKRDVFMDDDDYERFLKSMRKFNCLEPIGSLYENDYRNRNEKSERESNSQWGVGLPSPPRLVDIICYSLIPNHFHFILEQLCDDGISRYMHKVFTGYTNYFNLKNQRNGSLFQGKFKAVRIKSDEHLVWLSIYINKNAQIHGVVDDAVNYPWCSYPYYLGLKEDDICNRGIILNEVKDYKSIADETALFMKKGKEKNI